MPFSKINSIPISRKRCVLRKTNDKLFFSLLDYQNNKFMSGDIKTIFDFYSGFDNRISLIEWMKSRPTGANYIREVEGDKDIVVIIPTTDFNGKYSKTCRDEIFKGLHIIFVESGEIPDFYFNLARNVNVGLRKAMEYKPNWIIVSGDDMYKIDQISVLCDQLRKLDNKEYDVVFITPSDYHSRDVYVGKMTRIYLLHLKLIKGNFGRELYGLYKKFKVDYSAIPNREIYSLAFKRVFHYTDFTDFFIFSSQFVKQNEGYMFDEIYINNREDSDLSIRIKLENAKIAYANYRIGDFIGSSLGTGNNRMLTGVASEVYFNEKIDKILKIY